MSVTLVDRDAKRQDGKLRAYKMAAVKIPKGVLVCIDTTTGYATNGTDATNRTFAGVSYEGKDNSGGAAGDQSTRLEKEGDFEFFYGAGGANQALLGQFACITDNQTVDLAGATTNAIKCGVFSEVLSATRVRVRITGYAK